jgi:hypothetical protein
MQAPAVVRALHRAGDVRPFTERDIPAVARLHREAFTPSSPADASSLERYHVYFTRVFLHNPSRTSALPSLVFEEPDGRVSGFLGVAPRRMLLDGQPVQAAISSQFVVEPSAHAGFTAVRLAKTFLDGPQDLSISDEANDTTRRLWEALGGCTSLPHSLHWTRPLRPAAFALGLLRNRGALAPLAAAARPAAAAADCLALRLRASHFYAAPVNCAIDELGEEQMLAQLPAMAGRGSLRVDYDARTLHWLMERARQRFPSGRLHACALRDGDRAAGWFVYHLANRTADVLQVAATAGTIETVLGALFGHARAHGAVAASGRLEPRFLQAFSDHHCLLHRRGPWVLVHARRADLVRRFDGEPTFFTRLDGEWSLGF